MSIDSLAFSINTINSASEELRPSSFLQIKLYWPYLEQLSRDHSIACFVPLFLTHSEESSPHPGFGNVQGNQIDLLQTMSVFFCDVLNFLHFWSDVRICKTHRVETFYMANTLCRIFSNLSRGMLITIVIWFIVNHISPIIF